MIFHFLEDSIVFSDVGVGIFALDIEKVPKGVFPLNWVLLGIGYFSHQ